MTAWTIHEVLPNDPAIPSLVGRVWDTESCGPRVVSVRGNDVYDVTAVASTVSELLEAVNPIDLITRNSDRPRWSLQSLLDSSSGQHQHLPRLLAPIDLQVVKACGVTFVESMIERVIEERCTGDFSRAADIRALIGASLGGSITSLRPGSSAAQSAKQVLIAEGMWSQYLEVGIGPDPEIFTKAPVLSSVGFGTRIGIPTFSTWNNPEPELVLISDSTGRVRGATLGNDVNLRDIEGRSALLLGMAKDNNASCAIGPFIRLFNEDFTLETLREEEITVEVDGDDGYTLRGSNNLARISRPFEELLRAAHGPHHQYPDGFALFTGTLFAPTQDRGAAGLGFTHKPGDLVRISSRHLGMLANQTGVTEQLPPWEFGISALFNYLQDKRSANPAHPSQTI